MIEKLLLVFLILLLAYIFEVSRPIGVKSVSRFSTPEFFGVSVLTKGTIVSKFLGYLYSTGSKLWTEVIECDYLFPARRSSCGFIQHSPILGPVCLSRHQRGAPRHSSVPTERILGKRPPVDYWVEAIGFPGRPLVIQQDYSLAVTVRHVLMMTVHFKPPRGILVSLKQADEVLRKDRNTSNEGEESRLSNSSSVGYKPKIV
jgi:hypothetical protein